MDSQYNMNGTHGLRKTNYFGPKGLKRQHRWIENKI